jgi:hypothetical protein
MMTAMTKSPNAIRPISPSKVRPLESVQPGSGQCGNDNWEDPLFGLRLLE